MKSIKEKAEAYDKVLKWATEAHKVCDGMLKEDLERLFPELKESEDERMIQYFKDLAPFDKAEELYEKYGFSHKDAIAWLEKQGEQNQETNYPKFDFDDILAIQYCMETAKKVTEDKELYEKLQSLHNRLHDAYWIGKQGEKSNWKPSKDEMDALYGLSYITNKMDDKKDEAITKLYQDLKREFFDGASYENMFPSSPVDAPIKDEKQDEQKPAEFDDANAKRMFIKALERVEEQNNKGYKLTDCDKNSWWEDFKAYTTSKQILANSAKTCKDEQNPAWSEEDGEIYRKCICAMRASACGFPEEEKFVEQVDNWLKSLKERYTWRPSEEQMEALANALSLAKNCGEESAFDLRTLYEQLKQL